MGHGIPLQMHSGDRSKVVSIKLEVWQREVQSLQMYTDGLKSDEMWRLYLVPVACKGVYERCGHPPWGIQVASFRKKNVDK